MQYMLLIYGDEKAAAAMPKADVNKMLPAYEAYTRALQGAGALVAGSRLQTTHSASTIITATAMHTVQVRDFISKSSLFIGLADAKAGSDRGCG